VFLAAVLSNGPVAAAPPSPPPSPPTPAQVAGLHELEHEAAAYESAAREYRGVLTGIVRHHYEDRRRRVLASLDAELALEKKGLVEAREAAIKKLEAFVAAHSGAAAHPESTPDAMFRLAALYEERTREATDDAAELARALAPAIALYKRILREFPSYRERAAVHYYLGHAYDDAGRVAEAQQVWRALVCKNHFAYPTPPDPAHPERDSVRPLPQDHDRQHWLGWTAQRPAKGGKDLTFENPYPEDCTAVPQRTTPGADPRYLAETWWLLGDHHFNEVDSAGGPFNLNRAEAAYRRALGFKKPPVYGVAMYKLAWTYFKQQRYEAAVRQFVELLRHADEQERLTGDAGADFRGEAFTYIAASLTYVDFKGPDADEPYIPRADVLDTENDPRAAERKVHVAIERVQDGRLIPESERWTVDVYRALAREFGDLNQLHNMIEVDELVLKKWPFHRDAPVVQEEIASAWDRLGALERDGTAARAESAARALAARTKLSEYVGTKPWVQKNLGDPEAILVASRLARGGLSRAAADHTNAASALRERAEGLGEGPAKKEALVRALDEYRLAALGWSGAAADTDDTAAYEARFWLADAQHRIVALTVELDRSPAPEDVEASRRSAIRVRDSNEDDKYLEPAANRIVDLARLVVEFRRREFRRTQGKAGFEPREAVKTTGVGLELRVVSEPMPKEVAALVAARDEYVARVPAARDPGHNADLYRYQSAETAFVYGQFDEARRRLQPIYEQCKKTRYGFLAWRKLLSIANLEHDAPRSKALADAALRQSCATDEADGRIEHAMATSNLEVIGYEAAGKLFEEARKMPDGPDRAARWREVAALYRTALEHAPAAEAAPDAAMNGAYASKQVGDYEQAIGLYELFVREYGAEAVLSRLERGDSSTSPPKAPDPAAYARRVEFLERAYGGLSAAYVLVFDYRRAAATYDKVARNTRFSTPVRRDAARRAALLHATLGDRDRTVEARNALLGLDPTPEQRAEVDYQVATAELAAWDEHGLDEGANRAARLTALTAMEGYHGANKSNPAAAAYLVHAAHRAAMLRKAGHDPRDAEWCKNAVLAFEKLRAGARVVEGHNTALGSPEADLAAECSYELVDRAIKADLERPGRAPFDGTIDKVKKAYDADLAKAEGYAIRLQEIITSFESRPWSAAARARQASLYDGCRTRLYFAREPGLQLFNDREKKLLEALERSPNPDHAARADEYRQKRREDWRTTRDRMLEEADRPMLKGYAEAVLWARAWKVKHPAPDAAVQRLAFFTRLLGDDRVRAATSGIVDPETRKPFAYADGFFVNRRPGLPLVPSVDGTPPPRPALP
jgi:hypothetical protein